MKIIISTHKKWCVIGLYVCFIISFNNGYTQLSPTITDTKSDSVQKLNNSNTVKKYQKPIKFSGKDGPYLIGDTLYRVNSQNKLTASPFLKSDSLVVQVDNEDADTFYVKLQANYETPKTHYSLPKKMVIISDIEGNYNAFTSFLYANKVIDEYHNWIYGSGHLVLVGDFVDRGKNVTQVLWLIYKLEQEAKKQKGHVHFILGNHEVLNFQGDHKYNRGKYIKVAQEISKTKDKRKALKFLYSKKTVLGEWLATKNVIEKIGDYLFVHGGLSINILDYRLSLNEINDQVRSQYNNFENDDSQVVRFLYGPRGPFWYRGLVMRRYINNKITPSNLDKLLKYYQSKKIVIGHTPVKTISTDFNGKVIRMDVHHGKKKFSGKTKGLLVENNLEYIIDDNCTKVLLPNQL